MIKNKINHRALTKRLCYLFISTIVSLGIANAATVNPEQQLLTKLNRINSFAADFNQLVTDAKGKQLASSSGTIQILKPGNLLLQTLQPQNTTLSVINAKSISYFDSFVEQMTVYPINNLNKIPLSYIIIDAKLALNGVTVTEFNNCYNLSSAQISENFDYAQICFTDNQLSSVAIVEKNKNTNRYNFIDAQTNIQLLVENFQINVPPGTNIVQANE